MNKLTTYWQSLNTPDVYFNISYTLLMPMMLLLPFTVFFMWPFGVALLILCVSQWNWREKWENFKQNDGIPYGLFLLGIFLIPILGLLNSTNKPIAWSIFEGNLWFLFTPLIFLTTSAKLWTKRHVNTLLILFSAGEIALLVFFFLRRFYRVYKTGLIDFLDYNMFSFGWHHSYVSLYATFVYFLIFYYLTENSRNISKKRKILLYMTAIFLAVSIFYLYSRAGILIFLFMHLIWGGYAIYRKPSRWKNMISILIIVLASCALFIAIVPDNRFTTEALTFESKDGRNTDSRLIIWQAAWDIAVENLPWGVGTGDGNEVIMHKYHENGYWTSRNHPYNAHNQFLSALLTNGIPGLILVLLYFYAPLGLAVKHQDIFLLTIFLLMFLNCLVECMFDRRAGVDFFAIMIPLLLLRCKSSQCTLYNEQCKIHYPTLTPHPNT